jgi:hypothetical protein
MAGLITELLAWPTLGIAVLVFGFAPGIAIRLIVLCYPRGNPRRRELIGELYAVPRIERPFWVAEQLEAALFEGLRSRIRDWRTRRASTPDDPGAVLWRVPTSWTEPGVGMTQLAEIIRARNSSSPHTGWVHRSGAIREMPPRAENSGFPSPDGEQEDPLL